MFFSNIVFSWKLGRSKQLSATAVAAINSVTSGIQVLDERYYQPIDQSREGCFYFPEPEPGKVVRFPGQCEDIDVVQNFDLSKVSFSKDKPIAISEGFLVTLKSLAMIMSYIVLQFEEIWSIWRFS